MKRLKNLAQKMAVARRYREMIRKTRVRNKRISRKERLLDAKLAECTALAYRYEGLIETYTDRNYAIIRLAGEQNSSKDKAENLGHRLIDLKAESRVIQ